MGERRLIAVGRKHAAWPTQIWTYSSRDPSWHPQPPRPKHRIEEPDPSDVRKLRLESAEDPL